MSGVEAAAITLSTIIVKSAAKLWLGDRRVAAEAAVDAIELLGDRATSLIDRKSIARTFDGMVVTVAKKLTPYISAEFSGMPQNEKEAAILTVSDTFNRASYTDDYLFSNDLNAAYIYRFLSTCYSDAPNKALLSEAATELYDVLLRESCEYLVQVTLSLPKFHVGALTELLRRDSEIQADLQEILRRLPERSTGKGEDSFATDYRRQIINQLDQMELFGATISEASRRYPLSVAFISLNVSPDNPASGEHDTKDLVAPASSDINVDQALKVSHRIFLRGEAGSGKTTLMKWIAVRSALRDLPAELESWNESVPFLVPLRRYVDSDLPSPEQFPETVGRFISDEMPSGYVRTQLRNGQGIVLIDGLDEFPQAKRDSLRGWLDQLLSAFPEAKYVVTSRPGAVPSGWLRSEDFDEYELLSMTLADIRSFVSHWHEAICMGISDIHEREEVLQFERKLIERISSRRHLRALAETPLLCALLCALHFDRRGQLPNNRMELYDVALEMLLERRDAEHHVLTDMILSRTEKTLLLQDIAYWLIRNGWSDAEKRQVIDRIRAKLVYMTQIKSPASEVYRHLLERSGLIREPVAGRVDFVHKTFEEYLAALDALSANDIGLLVDHAHYDYWREVVIMAAGHAYAPKREELLRALVARGDEDEQHRDELHLLAVACLETSPELSHELRAEIRDRVRGLLPPTNVATAKSLASAGDFVVDLLEQSRPSRAREVAATIRAAAEIGSEAALRVITNYRRDNRSTVYKELLHAWPYFEPEDYAKTILALSPLAANVSISTPDVVPGLRHLPQIRDLSIRTSGKLKLQFVRDLPELRDLYIRGPVLEDLDALAEASNLESLRLPEAGADDYSVISHLRGLRRLDLMGSTVSNLDFISGLKNLRVLYIYATKISDLSELSGLENLEVLDIDGTRVKSLEPLRRCVKLHTLDIRATSINDLSPLSDLVNLQRLWIMGTKVSDLNPLCNATDLRVLYAFNTGVADLSPLASLLALDDLQVDYTKVTSVPNYTQPSKLRRLSARGSNLQNIGGLASCAGLSYLNIWNTSVSDLEPLTGHKFITELVAQEAPISDISPLSSMIRLRRLNLRRTGVSDLSPLAGLSRLIHLDIAFSRVRDFAPLLSIGSLKSVIVDSDMVAAGIPQALKGRYSVIKA
jgi:Leucine-rich repeat (LRR) protein